MVKMKFALLLIGLIVLLGCGDSSLPEEDWHGTWQDMNDPNVMVTFTEDGLMLFEVNGDGTRLITEIARYTVEEDLYTITFINNETTRNAGLAGISDTGGWTLSDGRLRLYSDIGGGFSLRRV